MLAKACVPGIGPPRAPCHGDVLAWFHGQNTVVEQVAELQDTVVDETAKTATGTEQPRRKARRMSSLASRTSKNGQAASDHFISR